MSSINVGLAMPFRGVGSIDLHAMCVGTRAKASQRPDVQVFPFQAWTSLLPYTFNLCWAGLLNQRSADGLTHFAMLHDDIVPQPGWLDILLAEMDAHDADLISAVVPIKDHLGLTSTGIDVTGDLWNPRRLTLAEVHSLPETFGDAEAGGPLVLNTGCWVCRIDRPWAEQVCFRQQDKIVKGADGKFEPHTMPEDWDFSRQLRSHGAKLLATRKVQLYHGLPAYTNARVWGSWKTDEACNREFGTAGVKPAATDAAVEPVPAGQAA